MNVRALQFEIGNNCNNNCDFCYLKESRVISSPEQQILNIKKVKQIIEQEIQGYNAVGLAGGEFFQGQLKYCKNEFFDLIKFICAQDIKELGLAAILIDENQDDLGETLDLLPKDKRILLCTSYDTMGRFHTAEQEEQGFKNIALVTEKYPHVALHTQTIITQHFIDKSLINSRFLKRILKYSMIDFKFPSMLSENFVSKDLSDVIEFRDRLLRTAHKLPEHFFIEDRKKFLQCLPIIIDICGINTLSMITSNEARSDKFYHLSTGIVDDSRGSKNNLVENAPCGHPGDSFCYFNSDKCARCDVQRTLEC